MKANWEDEPETPKLPPELEAINARLFHIENAYLVRRELYLHINTAVNSKTAEAYLKVINSHKGFFLPLLESALSYLINGLNRLVSSNDKKSLEKVINKMQSQGKRDFREELETLRTEHAKILSSVTDLRMEYFAHFGDADLSKIGSISEDEYIKLFEDVKNLVNKINGEYGNGIWYMEGDSREAIKDTHDLMDALLRGEAQRLSEINVEYLSETYRHQKVRWLSPEE